jgi:GR25 family glycosyltransferase involved in LPS biosynthesis
MKGFYINLDRRLDRKEQIEKEFADKGLDVERFKALEHPNGSIGCTASHLAVLKLSRQRGYESVMIFEDDFEFLVSKEEWDRLIKCLPESYDVVMLSYNTFKLESHDDTFERVLETQTASGYIVHSRFYNTLINRLEEGLYMFMQNPKAHWLYTNDQYWKALQPVSEWYQFKTRIGRQRAGFSDLVKKFIDYGV